MAEPAQLDPEELDIDGVRTFWIDGPEPATVVLLFRVGRSDESLAYGGISHLVEHLALYGLRDRHYSLNGFVEMWRTGFVASGTNAEIRDYLSAVTSALRALPLDRLETERNVLLTESASRQPGMYEAMSSMRYGAIGPGTTMFPEYGLHHLDGNQLSDWASRYFTKGNAAIWIHGPRPAEIELPLPTGRHFPTVPIPEEVMATPGWFHGPPGAVGISLASRRSIEMTLSSRVLQRRSIRRLRHDLGFSYTVHADYVPLSAERAMILLGADALSPNVDRVRDDLIASLDELAHEGATPDELLFDRNELARMEAHPDAPKATLDYRASEALLAMPRTTRAELRAMLEAVTGASVAEVMNSAMNSVIVSVPDGHEVTDRRFTAVPESSTHKVSGRTFRAVAQRGEGRMATRKLTMGDEGITFEALGRHISIRFDECVAVLSWQNGSRILHGADGSRLVIQPDEWRDGLHVIRRIDEVVPSERHVRMMEEAGTASASILPAPRARVPSLRPGYAKAAWATWVIVSLLLCFAPFGSPFVDASRLAGVTDVPLRIGRVDCGGSSWQVAFDRASPPMPAGPGRDLVARECKRAARPMMLAGSLGVISAAGAGWLAIRYLRRQREARAFRS
jgi:zinc protease